jgi:hypothetical protein
MDVFALLTQDADAMMTIQNRSIRSNLERALLTRG